MTITLPSNARGPILDLSLPASTDPVDITLRNGTTEKTLTLNLPAAWGGDDLSLDFFRRTIRDQAGADRSNLLDAQDNELWSTSPLIAGVNDVEIEVRPPVVGEDHFLQEGGNATGALAESGGAYLVLAGSDTSDFDIDASSHRLHRAATGDTGTLKPGVGRAIGLDVNLGDSDIRFDFEIGTLAVNVGCVGQLLRVVNATNFAWTNVRREESKWRLRMGKVVAGVLTQSYLSSSSDLAFVSKQFALTTAAEGKKLTATVETPDGQSFAHSLEDAVLSTTLAKGDAYIYDESESSSVNRYIDNLRIRSLAQVAFLATAQLRWESGHF